MTYHYIIVGLKRESCIKFSSWESIYSLQKKSYSRVEESDQHIWMKKNHLIHTLHLNIK